MSPLTIWTYLHLSGSRITLWVSILLSSLFLMLEISLMLFVIKWFTSRVKNWLTGQVTFLNSSSLRANSITFKKRLEPVNKRKLLTCRLLLIGSRLMLSSLLLPNLEWRLLLRCKQPWLRKSYKILKYALFSPTLLRRFLLLAWDYKKLKLDTLVMRPF